MKMEVITSLGELFNVFPELFELHGCATVYKNDHHGLPVAEINLKTGIIGIFGSTGNRFSRLSAIERVDIAQLVTHLKSHGHIAE
jgi:hypothetical protein